MQRVDADLNARPSAKNFREYIKNNIKRPNGCRTVWSTILKANRTHKRNFFILHWPLPHFMCNTLASWAGHTTSIYLLLLTKHTDVTPTKPKINQPDRHDAYQWWRNVWGCHLSWFMFAWLRAVTGSQNVRSPQYRPCRWSARQWFLRALLNPEHIWLPIGLLIHHRFSAVLAMVWVDSMIKEWHLVIALYVLAYHAALTTILVQRVWKDHAMYCKDRIETVASQTNGVLRAAWNDEQKCGQLEVEQVYFRQMYDCTRLAGGLIPKKMKADDDVYRSLPVVEYRTRRPWSFCIELFRSFQM